MLVTSNAIHQVESARLIVVRGRNWLFPLQASRSAMPAELPALFADRGGAAFEENATPRERTRHWHYHAREKTLFFSFGLSVICRVDAGRGNSGR